ncbi:hypothetical protein CAI21_10260 [Alkalilimnicola ehrlichii]|uniref:Metallo-beta-lactamase domain-containing protein n=1 Tax=Alkalilimnicola ehrlichii TaxID=351052 RepID=A0A3E0WT90_9GAMM|nr:MBL fold metallo-hydrolase [Alkalilimnicola ehrlichii]RFA29146.1 hypothetical protein CAI21_10260 [Alkalilimnicola ehrlichii]RFA36058.1 hypothetical protein CAL65_11410 [Alkalilimnicola ehrlichii]
MERSVVEARAAAPDTHVLSYLYPVPTLGFVPINAFVIQAQEPVLVDTGHVAARDEYMAALSKVVDLGELRWIWLTHTDPDHVGNLLAVMAAAPNARLITTFLGLGKLSLMGIRTERVLLLNPGQVLDIGDRLLSALRPPTYDAPETTALFDEKTRSLFSADSFGTVLAEPVVDAAALTPEQLHANMLLWSAIDSPWLEHVDMQRWSACLDAVRALAPDTVLSSHAPPASGITETLLANLADAVGQPPYRGPDQAAMEALMSTVPPSEAGMHGQAHPR